MVTGCDKATITGNSVLDCQEGMYLEALERSHVAGNRVSVTTTGYRFLDSLGFNVFMNNAVLRALAQKLEARQVQEPESRRDADVVIEPLGD